MGSYLLFLMNFLFKYSSPTCCFNESDTGILRVPPTSGQASHEDGTNNQRPGGKWGLHPSTDGKEAVLEKAAARPQRVLYARSGFAGVSVIE